MVKEFCHPGFSVGGIPDPKRVQDEIVFLQKEFEELTERLKKETDPYNIEILKQEKSRIGFILFVIFKPV